MYLIKNTGKTSTMLVEAADGTGVPTLLSTGGTTKDRVLAAGPGTQHAFQGVRTGSNAFTVLVQASLALEPGADDWFVIATLNTSATIVQVTGAFRWLRADVTAQTDPDLIDVHYKCS